MQLIITILNQPNMEWHNITKERAAQLIEQYWNTLISYSLEKE